MTDRNEEARRLRELHLLRDERDRAEEQAARGTAGSVLTCLALLFSAACLLQGSPAWTGFLALVFAGGAGRCGRRWTLDREEPFFLVAAVLCALTAAGLGITFLHGLEGAGLYIRGRLGEDRDPVRVGDCVIHTLPFFNGDEARALFPQEELHSTAQAMAYLCGREDCSSEGFHILMAHCFVGGAALSESDRAAAVGGASQVPAGAFAGFDYVALGHLHRSQEVAPGVRYSGSPLRYSFGEWRQTKSVSLVDTEDGSVREIPVPAARELRVVTGPLEELLEAARRDPRREDYLKVELTDCVPTMERVELFRAEYPNLLLVTGRQSQQAGEDGGITVEELERMSPEDLVRRFCREVLEEETDEETMAWFRQAVQAVEKEGEEQ